MRLYSLKEYVKEKKNINYFKSPLVSVNFLMFAEYLILNFLAKQLRVRSDM